MEAIKRFFTNNVILLVFLALILISGGVVLFVWPEHTSLFVIRMMGINFVLLGVNYILMAITARLKKKIQQLSDDNDNDKQV